MITHTFSARWRAAALLLVVSIAVPVSAGSSGPGQITSVTTLSGGQVLFTVSGSVGGRPSCATLASRWAIDGTTPAGQANVANVISAYQGGKSIVITGTGTCSVWGDTETAQVIEVSG